MSRGPDGSHLQRKLLSCYELIGKSKHDQELVQSEKLLTQAFRPQNVAKSVDDFDEIDFKLCDIFWRAWPQLLHVNTHGLDGLIQLDIKIELIY